MSLPPYSRNTAVSPASGQPASKASDWAFTSRNCSWKRMKGSFQPQVLGLIGVPLLRSHFPMSEALLSEAAADSRVIRVMIVEDHQVLADGLELALGRSPDVEVVGSVGTVTD